MATYGLGCNNTVPLTIISPLEDGISPAKILRNVDLPLPDGPRSATNSPSFIVKFKLSKMIFFACSSPYHLWICFA